MQVEAFTTVTMDGTLLLCVPPRFPPYKIS